MLLFVSIFTRVYKTFCKQNIIWPTNAHNWLKIVEFSRNSKKFSSIFCQIFLSHCSKFLGIPLLNMFSPFFPFFHFRLFTYKTLHPQYFFFVLFSVYVFFFFGISFEGRAGEKCEKLANNSSEDWHRRKVINIQVIPSAIEIPTAEKENEQKKLRIFSRAIQLRDIRHTNIQNKPVTRLLEEVFKAITRIW